MKHGGSIYKVAKKLHCQPEEIIDFSSNINSYRPPLDIEQSDEMIVKYADNSYKGLKKAVSGKYAVSRREMALFNGATAAIFELFRGLKPKEVTLYAPLYSEYERAAKEASKKIIKINRFEELYKIPKKRSIVVFVNPSTPDGKFYGLERLFDIWKQQKCTVILDESFLEFEKLPSQRSRLEADKRLYIVQSFTKFHACAGMRIGAVFSQKKNIRKLHTPRWNLSSFDAEFLKRRLEDGTFTKQAQKRHLQEKELLFELLQKSRLFDKIYPSDSNFFLVRSDKSEAIYRTLLRQRVLVRECENFDFLDRRHLRFAVKERASLEVLKKALDALS
mgnify:CR=1 FL=1